MINKLTKEQIDRLSKFTERKYVEWYDVQVELVDHLANGIEKQWETDKNVSFDEALNTEFKKFGIFGFNDLVEEKTKALNKHYRNNVWIYFKAFFRLPKIIITVFFVWTLFRLLDALSDKTHVMSVLVVIAFSIYLFHLIKFKIKVRKRLKQTGKKWLFEKTVFDLGGLMYILNIGIWLQPLFKSDRNWTFISELIVSLCIVLYFLVLYVSIKVVPDKMILKMSNEHPEYNFL